MINDEQSYLLGKSMSFWLRDIPDPLKYSFNGTNSFEWWRTAPSLIPYRCVHGDAYMESVDYGERRMKYTSLRQSPRSNDHMSYIENEYINM